MNLNPLCPQCGEKLKSTGPKPSWMNEYQWQAVKAGDYYCEKCPSNERGNQPLCYWWKSELASTQK